MSTPNFHGRWQPNMVYVVTKKQLQEWYDNVGDAGWYNGDRWEPVVKSLGVGRYRVSFKRAS